MFFCFSTTASGALRWSHAIRRYVKICSSGAQCERLLTEGVGSTKEHSWISKAAQKLGIPTKKTQILSLWTVIIFQMLGFACSMLGNRKTYSPQWWFNSDLSWYKLNNHSKQTNNVFQPLVEPHSKPC